jgi:hypothetical protein
MESTINSPISGVEAEQPSGVRMTPLGFLVLVLVLLGAGYGSWRYISPTAFVAAPPVAQAARAQPAALPRSDRAPQAAAASESSTHPAKQAEQESRARISKAQSDQSIQNAVSRALSAQAREQIADLDANVRALEDVVKGLPKTQEPSVRAARTNALDTAKMLHKKADDATATESVDVTTLPIETDSAASLNVTGFSKGGVVIGTQRLSVGQQISQGEVIVAIDPESHSIVTSRRIINVTY